MDSIVKAYKSMYDVVISEAFSHPRLRAISDSDMMPRYKNNAIAKETRSMIADGIDPGLENAKPLKGSSRATYLSSEGNGYKCKIDGVDCEVPTAMKIAFAGQLDRYNKSGRLLGEHQNEVEAYAGKPQAGYGTASMLNIDHDGNYHSNPDGCFAPVFDHHEDHHHLTMARIRKIGAGDFRRLTVTDDHPKGISKQEFDDALMSHYKDAMGDEAGWHYNKTPEARLEKVKEHPLVQKFSDACAMNDIHPADFLGNRNLGVWKHPVTGQEYIVAADYGFSNSVSREYLAARNNMFKARRGY